MYCIQTEAACSNDSASGLATSDSAGTSATSAYAPYWPCEKPGMVLTASPASNAVTSGPTARTRPMAPPPGTTGVGNR